MRNDISPWDLWVELLRLPSQARGTVSTVFFGDATLLWAPPSGAQTSFSCRTLVQSALQEPGRAWVQETVGRAVGPIEARTSLNPKHRERSWPSLQPPLGDE